MLNCMKGFVIPFQNCSGFIACSSASDDIIIIFLLCSTNLNSNFLFYQKFKTIFSFQTTVECIDKLDEYATSTAQDIFKTF